MSEAVRIPYRRTIKNDKPQWEIFNGSEWFEPKFTVNLNMESAYQLGLQSHPAPTDLLTDEEICDSCPNLNHHAGKRILCSIKDCSKYSERKRVAKSQLSKLQQARPQPEQVREKLASVLYKQAGNSLEWKFAEPGMKLIFYGKADELIKLSLLPDEQAIRESILKSISHWIRCPSCGSVSVRANSDFSIITCNKCEWFENVKSGERLEK